MAGAVAGEAASLLACSRMGERGRASGVAREGVRHAWRGGNSRQLGSSRDGKVGVAVAVAIADG